MDNVFKSWIRALGVDAVGVARLADINGMPIGMPAQGVAFLSQFPNAIVMGARLGKMGSDVAGSEVSLFLERAAQEVLSFVEEKGFYGLIIHTDDEFDPYRRRGLLSLKVLAKFAGLGWQGRSLLIISPQYGPFHRLIAVLTNMPLEADDPIPNRCEDCSECVDRCPAACLSLVRFEDHPASREDVLDVAACLGDSGCKVCLLSCPWGSKPSGGVRA